MLKINEQAVKHRESSDMYITIVEIIYPCSLDRRWLIAAVAGAAQPARCSQVERREVLFLLVSLEKK